MKLKPADVKWGKSKIRKIHLMNSTITKLKIKIEKNQTSIEDKNEIFTEIHSIKIKWYNSWKTLIYTALAVSMYEDDSILGVEWVVLERMHREEIFNEMYSILRIFLRGRFEHTDQ